MVVLVIIAVMSTAVVMTVPREKPAVEVAAQQLVRDANALSDAALTRGQATALGLSETGYALMQYRVPDWQVAQSADWPDNARVTFKRDKQPVILSDVVVPHILFEPTMMSTVFELSMTGDDAAFVLQSSGNGRVTLERLQ